MATTANTNSFNLSGFIAVDAQIREFTNSAVARFPLSISRKEENGETTTRIRLCVEVREGQARFSVQDNGRGIPKEQLPQLFTGVAHRCDNRTADGKRNMGLGLTVCSAIVHAHGGTISGRNLPQGGAEFAFLLPLEDTGSPAK